MDCLYNIRYLSLKSNGISKLEGLENLKNLETLDLGDNRIKRIDGETLASLINLKVLNLERNGLQ